MEKSKIKIILALLDLVLLAQQGTAFNYPKGENTYPLYGPTRDVELFEDTMDSDEEEAETNSNEERQTTNPGRGEQFDVDIKMDPEFYVRTMLRPTRAQFMVRPTRGFMARPTRAQFMVRPTRNSMA